MILIVAILIVINGCLNSIYIFRINIVLIQRHREHQGVFCSLLGRREVAGINALQHNKCAIGLLLDKSLYLT